VKPSQENCLCLAAPLRHARWGGEVIVFIVTEPWLFAWPGFYICLMIKEAGIKQAVAG